MSFDNRFPGEKQLMRLEFCSQLIARVRNEMIAIYKNNSIGARVRENVWANVVKIVSVEIHVPCSGCGRQELKNGRTVVDATAGIEA